MGTERFAVNVAVTMDPFLCHSQSGLTKLLVKKQIQTGKRVHVGRLLAVFYCVAFNIWGCHLI